MLYNIKGNIWSNKMLKITLENINKLSLVMIKFFVPANVFSTTEIGKLIFSSLCNNAFYNF